MSLEPSPPTSNLTTDPKFGLLRPAASLPPPPPPPPAQVVQFAHFSAIGSPNNLAFTKPVTAGNTIVIMIFDSDAGNLAVGPLGGILTLQQSSAGTGFFHDYLYTLKGYSSGAVFAVWTYSTSFSPNLWAWEISNVSSFTTSNVTFALDATNLSLPQTGAVLIAYYDWVTNAGVATWTTGFTSSTDIQNGNDGVEYIDYATPTANNCAIVVSFSNHTPVGLGIALR